MPMARAAPAERSRVMPSVKGPRSFTRTTTVLPVFGLPTSRQVPKGKDLWAAVNPSGSNHSPDAVRLPRSSLPYHVAATISPPYAGFMSTLVELCFTGGEAIASSSRGRFVPCVGRGKPVATSQPLPTSTDSTGSWTPPKTRFSTADRRSVGDRPVRRRWHGRFG